MFRPSKKNLALERESSDSSVSEKQRKEHVVIELIENDFLKGQILSGRRRLNVPWEKQTKQNIVSLLPFVARRFQSSVSGLSGPPIWPSSRLTTLTRPPPNTPHQPCLAPQWMRTPSGCICRPKIRLQRKQIPQGTKNG